MLLLPFAKAKIGEPNRKSAAWDHHHAGRIDERGHKDKEQRHKAKHDQRHQLVAAVVLIRHGPEERRHHVFKGRLQGGGLQDGLQRDHEHHSEGQHHDRHQRRGRDREGGDHLVFRGAAFHADNIAGVDGAGDLHVNEIAGDKGQVAAADPEHGHIDQVFHDPAHQIHQPDADKGAKRGGEVGHGLKIEPDQEGGRHQEHQHDYGKDAPQAVRPVYILRIAVLVFHDSLLNRSRGLIKSRRP